MALEDQDPRHQLVIAEKHIAKLSALLKRQQDLMKITIDLGDKLNNRNMFLRTVLKEAYDEGRKYPHDLTGSSYDRWLATKDINLKPKE